MPLLIWIMCGLAAAAVLAGVVLTVMGRGGRLTPYEADYAPPKLPATRPVVAGDVAALRLPLALWGYHVRAVDEVLERLSEELRERDRRIAALEHQEVEEPAVAGAASPSVHPPSASSRPDEARAPVEDTGPGEGEGDTPTSTEARAPAETSSDPDLEAEGGRPEQRDAGTGRET